jgi:hypothetical protein
MITASASVDGPEGNTLYLSPKTLRGVRGTKVDQVGLRGLVDGPGVGMPASINMLDDAEANSIHLHQLCDVKAERELSGEWKRDNTDTA